MMPLERECRGCGHFNNAAPDLEAALPGLSALSSAYAAVRGQDGLCGFHDRYVAATSVCRAYTLKVHGSGTTSTRQS